MVIIDQIVIIAHKANITENAIINLVLILMDGLSDGISSFLGFGILTNHY